ncbi:MAG: fengycin family lipopeptide synthetase D [Methyloprofundus sp.]|nr:MAG: fengycin family lipopeptide synthetase D [Methyloprofundus sp.]
MEELMDDQAPLTPLTKGQLSLWFLDQLNDQGTHYHISAAINICPAINKGLLVETFNFLINRHTALRSKIVATAGDIYQTSSTQCLNIPFIDATDLSDNDIKQQLNTLSKQRFDLQNELPIRLVAYQQEQRTILFCAIHHIVADFWSISILLEELPIVYSALSQQQIPALENIKLSFTEHCNNNAVWLTTTRAHKAKNYWQQQLGDLLPALVFTPSTPLNESQSASGLHHKFKISADRTKLLLEYAQQQHVTFFALLLAAYFKLLNKMTQQTDITIGIPVLGRSKAVEKLTFGYFVNPTAIRCKNIAARDISDLSRQINNDVQTGIKYQRYPFSEVVHEYIVQHHLSEQRNINSTPIFQSMFSLQQAQKGRGEWLAALAVEDASVSFNSNALTMNAFPIEPDIAQFDIAIVAAVVAEQLSIDMQYDKHCFSPEIITTYANNYSDILDDIIAPEPDSSPAAINAEQHPDFIARIIYHFEHSSKDVALASTANNLSYAEMATHCAVWQALFNTHKIVAGDVIAVMLPPGFALITVSIATFLQGAYLLLLDPKAPEERSNQHIQHADTKLLVTAEHVFATVLQTITVAQFNSQLNKHQANHNDWLAKTKAAHASQPQNQSGGALVFSSGSTGAANCTVLTRANLSYFSAAAISAYSFCKQDRVLQFTSPGFDAFYEELLPALCVGASIIPKSTQLTTDIEQFEAFLADNQISKISLPTAFWHAWVQQMPAPTQQVLTHLGTVIVGGESILPADITHWQRHMRADIKLFNSYGPSEATVICAVQLLDKSLSKIPPIGKLLPGTQGKILNDLQQEVSTDTVGELYISGPGVSPGYLKNISATHKKFVQFKDDPRTWFRTGDLVTQNSAGVLFFQKRYDLQIKINGVRIEPIEIEQHLNTLLDVNASVVMLINSKLIAFLATPLQPETNQSTAQHYRQLLKHTLLKEMLPHDFVCLANLPQTSAGKVDRAQLRTNYTQQTQQQAVVPTITNNSVAQLSTLMSTWIGHALDKDSNFFEYGMDSLTAVSIAANLSQHFNVHVPVRLLFDHPTLSALATALATLDVPYTTDTQAIAYTHLANIPLTPPQWRILALSSHLQDNWQPFNKVVIDLHGPLDTLKFRTCWLAELQQHDIFTLKTIDYDTRTQSFDAALKQQFFYYEDSALQHRTTYNKMSTINTIINSIQTELDVASAPFIKVALIKRDTDFYSFIIFSHQIVADIGSIAKLLTSFQARYNQDYQLHATDSQETPSYIQYATSIATLPTALPFWQHYLAGITGKTAFVLQTENAQASLQTQSFKTHISQENNTLIKQFIAEHKLLPSAFFIAIYYLILQRYNNSTDRFVIGTAVSHAGYANCLGPLTNFALLAPNFNNNDAAFIQAVTAIQADFLDLIDHQHTGFDEILQLLPSSAHGIAVECLFLYQQKTDAPLELKQLHSDIYSLNPNTLPALLCLEVTATDNSFTLNWRFDTGLYQQESVQQLAQAYQHFLLEGIKVPEQAHQHLSVLPDTLNQRCLGEVINWEEPCKLLHTTFTVTARKYPFRTAIIVAEQKISYGQLYRKSTKISRCIYQYKHQATPLIVGIFMHKGWEQITAALGVLRGGGTYAPINTNLDEQQLHTLLEQAGIKLIITTPLYKKLYKWPADLKVLTFEDPEIQNTSLIPLRKSTVGVQENDPAYIMFTSGTTGKPKGVLISHKSALNTIFDLNRRIDISSKDVIFGLSNFHFDLSVYDIFGTFSQGATLVLPSPDQYLDIEHWLYLLQKYQITIWNSVPALYRLLVDRCVDSHESTQLRKILLSGDWIPIDMLKDSFSALPQAQILGLGGATEVSIWSIFYPISKLDPEWTSIPYGFPLANQNCYVLDDQGELCPPDKPGELYIGGIGLAQAYINNPAATRSSFIEGHALEQRLYKTGDAAKLSNQGYFEILGRLDSRVKISGLFVDLSAIETAIEQFTDVLQAVVIYKNSTERADHLIAFVATKQNTFSAAYKQQQFAEQLSNYLIDMLARHMVPAKIAFINKIPLTTNGKVDRGLLQNYQTELFTQVQTGELPTSQLEKTLASIWQQLLKVDSIHMHDNFFGLGGDSLLLVSMATTVNQTLNIKLAMQSYFLYQTLAELVPIIDAQLNEQGLLTTEVPSILKGELPAILNKEVFLDKSIVPPELTATTEPLQQKVLLTGATGYLGSRLLLEILQSGSAEIYCLTRAEDSAAAKQRILNAIKIIHPLSNEQEARIIAIKGDLAKPLLGLTLSEYTLLAAELTQIIHCAAQVNFLQPRSRLKAHNVNGSIELLKLSVSKQLKAFNYISTVSVFPTIADDNSQTYYEDSDLMQTLPIVGGYPQSKWIAETTMLAARQRGLPINIFRPGVIFGDTRIGDLPSSVLLVEFLKICIDFGSAPQLDLLVDIAPVDYVAKAVIHAANTNSNTAFHLTNPQPIRLTDFVQILKDMGIPIKMIAADQWLQQLTDIDNTRASDGIKTLINLLQDTENIGSFIFGRNLQQFDCSNTLNALKGTDIRCPAIDEQFLKLFIDDLLGD